MAASADLSDFFIWDDHCGFELDPDAPLGPLLEPWRQAGVGYLSINVYFDPRPWTRCIENIAALRRRLPLEAPWCRIAGSVSDIDQAKARGEMAVAFDIEGMNALNNRIDMVQTYYELGVRHMVFAYNKNNAAGAGCHDEDIGITDFGKSVVDEMNRVGMVVDCSHTGFRTSMDAMERSSAPVVFSHSNPAALVDHGRNIRDEQIKACAAAGGVIGINGVNLFLGDGDAATAKSVARHAAYVAELVGPGHVGIALDYDPPVTPTSDQGGASSLEDTIANSPEYWPADAGYDRKIDILDVRELPAVKDELLAVGFSSEDLAGILGGNFRRVAEQVWK